MFDFDKIFEHELICEFLKTNDLTISDVKPFYAEISLYLHEPLKYKLKWNGYLEVVPHKLAPNPGIMYLGEHYFKNYISIEDVNYTSNPSKAVFIREILKSKNKNYFLTGSNGIGKTFLSLALANTHYENTKEKTLYVFWPDFIEQSKDFSSANSQLIKKVKYAKRLIIDDLGQESISQWGRDDVLNPIIAYRLERKLETVITSNYSFEELRNLYVLRPIDIKKSRSIVNKISGLCPVHVIDGEDLRNEL